MRGHSSWRTPPPTDGKHVWYWGAPAFGSGVLRLLVWGEPGLIFLPDPYGWLLFSKLVLYMLIVLNGALIERRYLPYVFQACSGTPGAHTALH